MVSNLTSKTIKTNIKYKCKKKLIFFLSVLYCICLDCFWAEIQPFYLGTIYKLVLLYSTLCYTILALHNATLALETFHIHHSQNQM